MPYVTRQIILILQQTKFYQDKKVNGVFMVTCKKQRIGACQRMVVCYIDLVSINENKKLKKEVF
jgi:hypothetical protein